MKLSWKFEWDIFGDFQTIWDLHFSMSDAKIFFFVIWRSSVPNVMRMISCWMSTNMLIFLQKIISVLILFFFASFCYNYFILRALRIAQIWFELHFCCTGALFWTLTRTKSSRVSFGICSLFKISQLSPLTTRLHQPKIYAISWLVRTSTRTFLRPFGF